MIIQLYPSENFDRVEARKLLRNLQNDGLPVEPGGTYHWRSIEDLPPLIQIVITGIAAGFLSGLGEDAWEMVKRVVEKAFQSKSQGSTPQIMLTIESDAGTSILWGIDPSLDINAQLDAALEHLQEIGEPTDLWYDKTSGKWQTLDERLSRRSKISSSCADRII